MLTLDSWDTPWWGIAEQSKSSRPKMLFHLYIEVINASWNANSLKVRFSKLLICFLVKLSIGSGEYIGYFHIYTVQMFQIISDTGTQLPFFLVLLSSEPLIQTRMQSDHRHLLQRTLPQKCLDSFILMVLSPHGQKLWRFEAKCEETAEDV